MCLCVSFIWRSLDFLVRVSTFFSYFCVVCTLVLSLSTWINIILNINLWQFINYKGIIFIYCKYKLLFLILQVALSLDMNVDGHFFLYPTEEIIPLMTNWKLDSKWILSIFSSKRKVRSKLFPCGMNWGNKLRAVLIEKILSPMCG